MRLLNDMAKSRRPSKMLIWKRGFSVPVTWVSSMPGKQHMNVFMNLLLKYATVQAGRGGQRVPHVVIRM